MSYLLSDEVGFKSCQQIEVTKHKKQGELTFTCQNLAISSSDVIVTRLLFFRVSTSNLRPCKMKTKEEFYVTMLKELILCVDVIRFKFCTRGETWKRYDVPNFRMFLPFWFLAVGL